MSIRYFTQRVAQLWISSMTFLRGARRAIARAIVTLVDSRTGGSHPRYPITLERIANEAGCCVATVCRHVPALEAARIIVVRRSRPRRTEDGTLRQDANDYEVLLPPEHWREIKPVEQSVAARASAPVPPASSSPVEQGEPVSRWSRAVRGTLSTRDASSSVPLARWNLNTRDDTMFVDETHYIDLAPVLLTEAKIAGAAEGIADEIRHRVVTCLHELQTRAQEVALLCCNLLASSNCARAAVRAWVRKCLLDPQRRIDSAEHAMNILRKFVREQAAEGEKGRERRRVKREQKEEQERVAASRARWAHISVRYSGRDDVAPVVEDNPPPPSFGYEDDEGAPF